MEKEGKEIGKLLELLNEFYKEEGDIFRAIQHNDRLKVFELENDDLVRDAAIISKQYGFIKWLVENDKIDISKIKCGYVYNDTEEDKVKNVIMNLSISDTSIEDLISYLR